MPSESQYQWNHPSDMVNVDALEKKSEDHIEDEADKLFREDKLSDLQISQRLGITYAAVKMLRIRYEKAHLSGN